MESCENVALQAAPAAPGAEESVRDLGAGPEIRTGTRWLRPATRHVAKGAYAGIEDGREVASDFWARGAAAEGLKGRLSWPCRRRTGAPRLESAEH